MSSSDVLLGIWQNGGQVVVIGAAGYGWATVHGARSAITTNNRRVDELNRDLRRWIRDRNRQLDQELALISAYANDPELEGPIVDTLIALRKPVPDAVKNLPAGSQYHSGAHLRWRAQAKERALHEYRDRATATLDEFRTIIDSEGAIHRAVRRRRSLGAPRLRLPTEARETLASWREAATAPGVDGSAPVEDVSREALEPALRAIETN